MTQTPGRGDGDPTLDDVLITDELTRRAPRPPDHAAEARALGALAQALVAHLPGAAAFVVDHDLRYLVAAGAALDDAGLTPTDLVGRTVDDALGPAAAADHVPDFRRALAGETFAREHAAYGRVYLTRGGPLRDAAGRVEAVVAVSTDITARRDAEAALRASEARQAFLLALSDALRPLADPVAVQATAARLLGEHLGATRVHYGEVVGGTLVVHHGYGDHPPPMGGTLHHAREGWDARVLQAYRAGRTVVCRDVAADPTVTAAEAAAMAGAGVRAYVAVPLLKAGAWVATLSAHGSAPRDWTDAEVALVEETAERTWAAVERTRAEAALTVREEQYRAIVEGARDYVIVTTDADGRIESWSPGAESVFGWPAAEAVGQPIGITFLAEDRAAGVPEQEQAQARAHGVAPDVRWHRRRDDTRVFVDGMMRALRDGAGRVRGFLKVGQDVTRRRELDDALRASEARVRTLVEHVRDYAIFLVDAEGRVTEWTAGAERMTGYRPDEVAGRHLALFYTPEDVAADVPARHLAEAAATGRGEWEGWRVRKDGARFWANEIATAVHDTDGRLTGFTKISRDLTERRLAERAAEQTQLAAARDELRRALAAAEEGERRRLARELHDQLGQHLAALALGLAEARRRLATVASEPPGSSAGETPRVDASAASVPLAGVAGVAASLERLEELARLMTRDARTLALELRPPELDDVGLVSAVETYVREWSARTGVAAEVAVTGGRDRELPADVASALYRILQEALTNVAKHAGATQVSVIVEQPDGEVGLIVEDDGHGFDAGAVAARVRRDRRLGLAGMRERAALAGGRLAIESRPGSGTTVYARLPMHAPVPPSSTSGALGDPPGGFAALIPLDGPDAGQDSDP